MQLVVDSVSGTLVEVQAARPGFRRFGIPPGGPMDELAFGICSAFNAPVYELRWGQCQITTLESCSVLLVGRGLVHQCLELKAHQPVRISVQGGLTTTFVAMPQPVVFEARLTNQPVYFVPANDGPTHSFELKGTTGSTRMGVKLSGCAWEVGPERPSQPAEVGTMQLTPDGTVLVIGPDGPTVGGYSQIGTIARCSRWQMAHWLPGEVVEFVPISVEEARIQWRQQQASLIATRESIHHAHLASE